MFSFRPDLPFERDGSTRFLPLIVALMVFLATLATAGVLALENAIARWDAGLTGRLTVQVPSDGGEGDDGAAAPTADAVPRLVEILTATPGVASARVLDEAEVRRLLAPWLGDLPADGALPLPGLIDVQLAPGAQLDAAPLAARLAEVAPGVAVDDHRAWLAGLFDLARTVEAVALVIVTLIGVAAVGAVVFVTRSGLAVHRPLVELLHLMGARDSYIARQFQHNAFRLGLRGGLLGSLAAGAVIAAVGAASARIDAAFLPPLQLVDWQWGALAAVPVAAVIIAMVTARQTVLRTLARMP